MKYKNLYVRLTFEGEDYKNQIHIQKVFALGGLNLMKLHIHPSDFVGNEAGRMFQQLKQVANCATDQETKPS